MDRAETGRTGEAVAARYYQKQGCELVAHNYRTRMGKSTSSCGSRTAHWCSVRSRPAAPTRWPRLLRP